MAEQLDVQVKIERVGEEYLDIIKNPEHGYGKNMNPCIDCRIHMHKKAKQIMEEEGAAFIITGEVLGQRPMSQRRDAMNLIDRESGLKGLVLRPLCAKVMSPTIPETNGFVDRDKLLKITGRGRKPQIELAEQFNITDYPCAAGGCLLTDQGFARRLKDLLKYNPDADLHEIMLLKTGRHHRLPSGDKLVVGRNKSENERLETMCRNNDILFQPAQFHSATGFLRLETSQSPDLTTIQTASSIMLHYSKDKHKEKGVVRITSSDHQTPDEIEINRLHRILWLV